MVYYLNLDHNNTVVVKFKYKLHTFYDFKTN